MQALASLSFAAPLALIGLAALPLLWWLLRVVPPSPRRVAFPPIRLLFRLAGREETAARTPWWLMALRLLLAAAVVIGAAHPLIGAGTGFLGTGPLTLVVDDGWAAARDWPARRNAARILLERAEREGRSVILLTTAPPFPAEVEVRSAAETGRRVEALRPKPWNTGRQALAVLTGLVPEGAPGPVFWLADGLEEGNTPALVKALRRLGPLTVLEDAPSRENLALRPPVRAGNDIGMVAIRTRGGGERILDVLAIGGDGRPLARETLSFAAGERKAASTLVLPSELRNRLARLEIAGETTAGAVTLADERWHRRPVGLVAGGEERPLLGDFYYVERALEPFAEIRRGGISDLLARELAVLVLADPGPLAPLDAEAVERWTGEGGTVVRFAGPRLAEDPEARLPVLLRGGDRALGGALSWSQPARLAPFPEKSPFAGLAVPDDVRVRRQVLAQPSLDLADRTWARLADGTPLVTAAEVGRGRSILFHITANTQWSDLPISGLFVEMLRRIVDLTRGSAGKPGGPPLKPLETLDGFGRLEPAPIDAAAIPTEDFATTLPGPGHPPGFYGDGAARRALNLTSSATVLEPMARLPDGVMVETYGERHETDLRPWFFSLAMALFLLDLGFGLRLRGYLGPRLAQVLAALAIAASGAAASADDGKALAATNSTRLAYVITGDDDVDALSRAGLVGLGLFVSRRTAAELGEPAGVDPAVDELAFYPLLFWPLAAGTAPEAEVMARLNTFMRNGGTILIDSRDHSERPAPERLRGLDIPALAPLGPEHVLTRSFYLLKGYPGRWSGSRVWVEQAGETLNDGVSRIIIGSHDWIGAWAMDDLHRPLLPVVPGGERQREEAFRFGINLVMYVLTGNYKGDQVHLPAIRRRTGP